MLGAGVPASTICATSTTKGVVEVEVRRIVKEHFTNLAVKSLPVDIDFEIELLDGFFHLKVR